jgi:tetratricopeptide (TPR) repeat protein
MKTSLRFLLSIALFTMLSGLALPSFAQSRAPAVIDTELAQTHYRRGNTYNNMERYDEAIEEYQLSITADPNFADSVRNLANIFYFQERYEETIPLLQRFIVLQKETIAGKIAAYNTLGQLLRDAKRYDEAIEVDLLAIEHDPENSSQVYVMANTYFNAGLAHDAVRIYKKALTVAPNDAFIHRSLGRMLEDEGMLQEALLEYRAAADLNPDSQFYRDLVMGLESRLAQ